MPKSGAVKVEFHLHSADGLLVFLDDGPDDLLILAHTGYSACSGAVRLPVFLA